MRPCTNSQSLLSILDLAAEEAQRQGSVRVLGIHLKLGCLSGVVKEALLSAYDLAREGTPFEETRADHRRGSGCGALPELSGPRAVVSVQELCCAECGTPSPDVASGRDLELVAMEIHMSAEPRLIQVRQHILKQNDVVARALRQRVPRSRGLRSESGVEPGHRKDHVSGKAS